MQEHEDTSAEHGDDSAAYVLARLATRRSVRAAMALSSLRGGVAAAREAWSTPTAVDAPTRIARRLAYPELRVAHVGDGSLAATSAPCEPLRGATWRTRLDVVRPDLVLIDGAGELSGPDELRDVVLHAHALGLRTVATGAGVAHVQRAGLTAELTSVLPTTGTATARDATALDPWFDPRLCNPIGLHHEPDGVWRLDLSLGPDARVAMARRHAVVTAPLSDASPTDHAQAVLGLLASGVPVVAETTPVLARLLMPHDELLVPADEIDQVSEVLRSDEVARERASVRLRRHVLAHHAAPAAFERVLDMVDLPRRPTPTISVLLATRRPEFLADALAAVDRQDHPDLDVQLVLHGITPTIPQRALSVHRTLTVHHVPEEQPLGAALNVALDAATGQLFAKMDDDDLYGPGHLSDLLVALGYSGAEAVGRWSNTVYLEDRDLTVHQNVDRQERWAHHLPGCTMLVHGDVLRSLRWRLVPRGVDTELVRAIHGAGGRCYGTHRFGFIRRRHGDHTFARSDRAFTREGRTHPGLDRSVLDV